MLLSDMTYRQYLINPTGPYSSFFGKRESIKKDLENRFYKLLAKTPKKDFDCKIYKEKDSYYFHIKIPSEEFDNIFYDVIIKLSPPDSVALNEGSLYSYKLSFFSNSPAFVYTYAYISKKDKVLIPFMEHKLSTVALTTPPKVRNPIEIYGFEKSIYFSLLYIQYKNYHIKSMINSKSLVFNQVSLYSKCKHSDLIQKEYNKEKAKKVEENKAKKQAEKEKRIALQAKTIKDKNEKRNKKVNKVIKPKKKI